MKFIKFIPTNRNSIDHVYKDSNSNIDVEMENQDSQQFNVNGIKLLTHLDNFTKNQNQIPIDPISKKNNKIPERNYDFNLVDFSELKLKQKLEYDVYIQKCIDLNRCIALENNEKESQERCRVCYQFNSFNFNLDFKPKQKNKRWQNFSANKLIKCLGPECKIIIHKICLEHSYDQIKSSDTKMASQFTDFQEPVYDNINLQEYIDLFKPTDEDPNFKSNCDKLNVYLIGQNLCMVCYACQEQINNHRQATSVKNCVCKYCQVPYGFVQKDDLEYFHPVCRDLSKKMLHNPSLDVNSGDCFKCKKATESQTFPCSHFECEKTKKGAHIICLMRFSYQTLVSCFTETATQKVVYYHCSKSDSVVHNFFPEDFSKLVKRILSLENQFSEPLIQGEQIFQYDIVGFLRQLKSTNMQYLDYIVFLRVQQIYKRLLNQYSQQTILIDKELFKYILPQNDIIAPESRLPCQDQRIFDNTAAMDVITIFNELNSTHVDNNRLLLDWNIQSLSETINQNVKILCLDEFMQFKADQINVLKLMGEAADMIMEEQAFREFTSPDPIGRTTQDSSANHNEIMSEPDQKYFQEILSKFEKNNLDKTRTYTYMKQIDQK